MLSNILNIIFEPWVYIFNNDLSYIRKEENNLNPDHYIIEEDSSGIIGRLQEHGGEHSGVYVVCFKDFFNNLVVSCISQVVEQKFGSKAARVFRYCICAPVKMLVTQ